MFTCQKCKKGSKPYEKAFKQVVQTRKKIYPEGQEGSEIVKEITICKTCAA